MSIAKLLLRFLQQRAVASALTVASIAIGVALTAAILTLRVESERAFSQKDTGFEIIVGAKGSPLQLVLNTMYHLGAPVGNFPLAECERIQADKRIKFSLPMVFGDNVGGYKVVGTTPDFFGIFEYRKGKRPEIAQGRAFARNYEAVLGAEAAQNLRKNVGDSVVVRHGLDANEEGAHDHGSMPIVGVLAPTGTAIDRGVYMTMRTVWDTHYHEYEEARIAAEKALEAADGGGAEDKTHTHGHDGHDHDAHDHEHNHDIPPEFTTVTALAVKLKSPVFYDSFMRNVNDGASAQAAVPIREIMGLFRIVGNLSGLLLGISYLVIVLGAVSIAVAMYTSLNERRREIAILRSLGAHKRSIIGILVSEAAIIGALGGALGLCAARLGLIAAEGALQQQIGASLSFTAWYSFDWLLLAGVLALTAFVGLVPALTAYRADVARNLAPQT
jgi:putative ABC transport system permease protein